MIEMGKATMKTWELAAAGAMLVGGLTGLLGAAGWPVPTTAQAELTWHSDYSSAQRTARQAGKPLFVVFR
jgi:hypothetical protein